MTRRPSVCLFEVEQTSGKCPVAVERLFQRGDPGSQLVYGTVDPLWCGVQERQQVATQDLRHSVDTVSVHMLFHNEREARLLMPAVDGRQRPANLAQCGVGSDGGGEAHHGSTLTRPVLEGARLAADRHAIRTFGAEIIAVDQSELKTQVLRSTLDGVM